MAGRAAYGATSWVLPFTDEAVARVRSKQWTAEITSRAFPARVIARVMFERRAADTRWLLQTHFNKGVRVHAVGPIVVDATNCR